MISEVELLKAFILVLIRFSGLMISAPVLSSRNFPVMARAGLVGMMSLIVAPLLPLMAQPLPSEAIPFVLLGVQELIVGLAIGFVISLVFAAIQVAGEIMDMLSGFSMVNVFNPAMETQVPIFGFFYYLVAILFLLSFNGHHLMIRALVASFDSIPVGGLAMRPEVFRDEVLLWGTVMFRDGFMIAAPVAGALTLAYVTMGLLGRMVPQIHLFAVGFPITISIALVMAMVSLEMYVGMLRGMFTRAFENVSVFMGSLG
jgi:flagellar biosynthetic protein FliR